MVAPAPLDRDRLLAALREAILAERAGASFYENAARATDDAQGRETFLMLAGEESLHEKYLRDQYALVAAGRTPEPLVNSSGAAFDLRNPVFSPELRHRIGTAHQEMTALSIGIQLEQNSAAYYRRLAKEAGIPELEHFFEKLAQWEEGHGTALHVQYQLLLESYWQEAGFAPF